MRDDAPAVTSGSLNLAGLPAGYPCDTDRVESPMGRLLVTLTGAQLDAMTALPPDPLAGFGAVSHRCRAVVDGRCLEFDVIAADEAAWEERPESRDPGWTVRRHNGLVLAYLLTIG